MAFWLVPLAVVGAVTVVDTVCGWIGGSEDKKSKTPSTPPSSPSNNPFLKMADSVASGEFLATTKGIVDAVVNDKIDNPSYWYNPKTKQWEKKPGTSLGSKGSSLFKSSSGVGTNTRSPVTDSISDVNSKNKAEREYINEEISILQADIELRPSITSLSLRTGQTVKIQGVGKYLSGLYYISSISRKYDNSSGFSCTLSTIRTGFGDSLKKFPAPSVSTSSLNKGDKVRIVGADAFYTNADYGVPVPQWVKERDLTIDAISEDGQRVRLMPIWSWTYVKFIKHV